MIREIVQDYLRYIQWGEGPLPEEITLRRCEPSKVVVDVAHAFGQPRFAGTRVRVAEVAAMVRAGESAEVVADEFGISTDDVRAAARVLLGRAA